MGRVIVFDNPLNPQESRSFKYTGPLIDFLLAEFPNGFDGDHVVAVNGNKLQVCDYDRAIKDDEIVTILLFPAGFIAPIVIAAATKIGAALIAAGLSLALSYVISSMTKGTASSPSYTKASLPSADTVYTFSGSANTARIGETIPVAYGRNLIAPDLAMQPWTYFWNNDQYLVLLNCLGQGDFDIHEIYMAGNALRDLGADVVQVDVYPPGRHQQQFGRIQNELQGRWENVYTSPAVADQELDAASIDYSGDDPASSGGEYWGYFTNSPAHTISTRVRPSNYCPNHYASDVVLDLEYRPDGGMLVLYYNPKYWKEMGYIKCNAPSGATSIVPAAELKSLISRINHGKPVYIVVNEASYKVSQITDVPFSTDEDGVNRNVYVVTLEWQESITSDCSRDGYGSEGFYQTVSIGGRKYKNNGSDRRACKKFPASLHNKCNFFSFSTYEAEEASVAGGFVGPFIATPRDNFTTLLSYDLIYGNGCYRQDAETGNIQNFTVKVQFVAEAIDHNNNPTGASYTYNVEHTLATTTPQRFTIWHSVPYGRYRVKAQRITAKSDKAYDNSNVTWVGLKSVLGHPAGGPVYGDVTLLSVQIKATEGLASNAHSAMTVDCTRMLHGQVLRNPANAFIDILRNPIYGAKRPESEVDYDTLDPLRNRWQNEGRVFDAVFDNETTVWDALKLSVQMQSAMPVALGSKISLIEDKAHDVPDVIIDESKIKSLTLSYSFVSSDDYDGVEGKYKNPNDNVDEYVYWPPYCANPEEMTLWGCKDYNQALAFVKFAWKKRQFRRQLFTMETEGDGHTIHVGQAIAITHPLVGERVMAVVSSVSASEEFSTTIDGFIYRHEVFE